MNNEDHPTSSREMSEGAERAMSLIRDCTTSRGFLASSTDVANYRRIWGRDGVIIGLAALMTRNRELVATMRATLETLMDHQGPHGEIPSNVDPDAGDVSYGGTAGRVDADLWFVIGCGEYWRATEDEAFLEKVLPAVEKVRFLLGAWEFNNRGLIYVPQTGDWADEYIHNGYVLYDQLLYLQAQRSFCALRRAARGSCEDAEIERMARLRRVIQANYWFDDGGDPPEEAYHKVLYERGHRAARASKDQFWLPFFAPYGYGYRFDALANIMASLLDVADDDRRSRVDRYLQAEVTPEQLRVVPAFYPVITPQDGDWHDLQMDFSNTFKNEPHQYQNGGLWPMITGFYVADLAKRGQRDIAQEFLRGVHQANAMEMESEPWSFPEYVHGVNFVAEGTRHQGWSAAGALIGHFALAGEPVFRIS
jgi:glycogen debranching enzyme